MENEKDIAGEKGTETKEETSRKDIKEEQFFPELTFTTFLLSLSTSAIVSLGELPDPFTGFDPIQFWHDHIQNDQVRQFMREHIQRFFTIRPGYHIVSFGFEVHFKQSNIERFIVDDKDFCCHF